MEKKISIAIDGPAAAGKSTIAKIVAQKLLYTYIDTGAMYRALTYKALEHNLDIKDEDKLLQLLMKLNITFEQGSDKQQVFVNDENITELIRNEHVTKNVSHVAKHPNIRKEMVNRQRSFANDGGVVMDGRDIGTHVLPEAEVKIYLIASPEERAKRRYRELLEKGYDVDLEELKKEIIARDSMDMNRTFSPLVKAEDAIEIDSTLLSIEGVVEKVLLEVEKKKNE